MMTFEQIRMPRESPEEQRKHPLPDVMEHLKHAYFFELQRREEIEKRVQAPITILVGLIGGFFILTLQSLKHWHWAGVVIFFACTLSMLIMTSFCFGKYMWPKDYKYVCLPMELLDEYRKTNEGYPNRLEPDEFTDWMMQQYAESTNHNRDVNRDRSDWYAKGWRYLFYTLAAEGAWVSLYLALAIPPY